MTSHIYAKQQRCMHLIRFQQISCCRRQRDKSLADKRTSATQRNKCKTLVTWKYSKSLALAFHECRDLVKMEPVFRGFWQPSRNPKIYSTCDKCMYVEQEQGLYSAVRGACLNNEQRMHVCEFLRKFQRKITGSVSKWQE